MDPPDWCCELLQRCLTTPKICQTVSGQQSLSSSLQPIPHLLYIYVSPIPQHLYQHVCDTAAGMADFQKHTETSCGGQLSAC